MELHGVITDQIVNPARERLQRRHRRTRIRSDYRIRIADSTSRSACGGARRVGRRQGGAFVNFTADQGEHRSVVGQKERVAAGLREKAHLRVALPDIGLKIERQRGPTRGRVVLIGRRMLIDRRMGGCRRKRAAWTGGNACGQHYCGKSY
jgi:hypothetical protein